MESHTIAVIEDEGALLNILTDFLRQPGQNVLGFRDAEEFFGYFAENAIDLIVTDLSLPGMDGYKVVETVRKNNPWLPILIITGSNQTRFELQAMEMGADDFIGKPFNFDVLRAKVDRQMAKLQPSPQAVDIVCIDESCELQYRQQLIKLTAREYWIFKKLFLGLGDVISRGELQGDFQSKSLDVHMSSLRKKLKPIGVEIRTFKGLGYKLILLKGS